VIRIECKGADELPLDKIEEFQGSLKKRSKKDIERIITSIQKYGFSFPFFIWTGDGHNYCLDGHGRIQALSLLRQQGESLPLFPVVYVSAMDENEAKEKLLRLNSQYGQITMPGFMEFTEGVDLIMDELNISGIEILDIEKKEVEDQKDETIKTDKPYKSVHILLSMSPDSFLENIHLFKDMKKISGVEYVQSEN